MGSYSMTGGIKMYLGNVGLLHTLLSSFLPCSCHETHMCTQRLVKAAAIASGSVIQCIECHYNVGLLHHLRRLVLVSSAARAHVGCCVAQRQTWLLSTLVP